MAFQPSPQHLGLAQRLLELGLGPTPDRVYGLVTPIDLHCDGKMAMILGGNTSMMWYTYVRCTCEECQRKQSWVCEDDDVAGAYKTTNVMSVVQFLEHCRPGVVTHATLLRSDEDQEQLALRYMRAQVQPREFLYLGDLMRQLGDRAGGAALVGQEVFSLDYTRPPHLPNRFRAGKLIEYDRTTGCHTLRYHEVPNETVPVHVAFNYLHVREPPHAPAPDSDNDVSTFGIDLSDPLLVQGDYPYNRSLDQALAHLPNAGRAPGMPPYHFTPQPAPAPHVPNQYYQQAPGAYGANNPYQAAPQHAPGAFGGNPPYQATPQPASGSFGGNPPYQTPAQPTSGSLGGNQPYQPTAPHQATTQPTTTPFGAHPPVHGSPPPVPATHQAPAAFPPDAHGPTPSGSMYSQQHNQGLQPQQSASSSFNPMAAQQQRMSPAPPQYPGQAPPPSQQNGYPPHQNGHVPHQQHQHQQQQAYPASQQQQPGHAAYGSQGGYGYTAAGQPHTAPVPTVLAPPSSGPATEPAPYTGPSLAAQRRAMLDERRQAALAGVVSPSSFNTIIATMQATSVLPPDPNNDNAPTALPGHPPNLSERPTSSGPSPSELRAAQLRKAREELLSGLPALVAGAAPAPVPATSGPSVGAGDALPGQNGPTPLTYLTPAKAEPDSTLPPTGVVAPRHDPPSAPPLQQPSSMQSTRTPHPPGANGHHHHHASAPEQSSSNPFPQPALYSHNERLFLSESSQTATLMDQLDVCSDVGLRDTLDFCWAMMAGRRYSHEGEWLECVSMLRQSAREAQAGGTGAAQDHAWMVALMTRALRLPEEDLIGYKKVIEYYLGLAESDGLVLGDLHLASEGDTDTPMVVVANGHTDVVMENGW